MIYLALFLVLDALILGVVVGAALAFRWLMRRWWAR